MSAAPRVVIGAGRPNRLAALVCEWSIRRRCPQTEVIHTWSRPFLPELDSARHRDQWSEPCQWLPLTRRAGTLFSLCRVMTPEICGFSGQAIYLDSDTLVLGDIRELWDRPMAGALVLHAPQRSVLKLDCAALDRKEWTVGALLRARRPYHELVNLRYLPAARLRGAIPADWNSLDRLTPTTKLLHYTTMPTQPWVRPGHPHGELWFDHLAEALRDGAIDGALVEAEVRAQDLRRTWQAAVWPQPHVLEELGRRM